MNVKPSTSAFLKDSIKEFNQNYKNYLENKLLFSILFDSINSLSLTSSSTIGSGNSIGISNPGSASKHDSSHNVNHSIEENFWKSFLITNVKQQQLQLQQQQQASNDQSNNVPEFDLTDLVVSSPTSLSNEAKTVLIKRVEQKLENYLIEMNSFLKLNKEVFDENEDNQDEEKDTSIYDSFEMSNMSKLDSDKILAKIKRLIETNKLQKTTIERLNQDIDAKLNHCYGKCLEIVNLLKTLLNDFKLEFYSKNENKFQFENEILKFDLLIKKIQLVRSEIINETYSPDRIKCLQIIKSNIEFDKMNATEQYAKIKNNLEVYKSLGSEFDTILKSFLDLKEQLERKKYFVEKLKGDEIIY